MNIVFWTDGFWPRIGGIETQAIRFIEQMLKRGHRFLVIAQLDEPDWKAEEEYNGIWIKRFDFNHTFGRTGIKNLRAIEQCFDWIKEVFKPDLIHLNTYMGWSAFFYLTFHPKICAPVCLTVHSPVLSGINNKTRIDRVFALCNRICCVSKWVLHELEAYAPECREKLRLCYNGLPMPNSQPKALCFSPPAILLLGRFTSEKGFDTAIAAFSELKKRGSSARLLIGGAGPEGEKWENLALHLELVDSVQFLGKLTPDEVPEVINGATMVVVPSSYESFGLVALEAMQMGRPVIASAIGGLLEIVLDGATGILVPPQDPIALCDAMEALLKAPETAIAMGGRGRERAKTHFTLEQNLDLYEEMYLELAGAAR